jgi:hypothetical protein
LRNQVSSFGAFKSSAKHLFSSFSGHDNEFVGENMLFDEFGAIECEFPFKFIFNKLSRHF